MRYIIIILIFFSSNIGAQYIVNLANSGFSSDLDVKIEEGILYADIDVELSESVLYEDFTIGFTTSIERADVVISNSSIYSDISIFLSESIYPDLTVDVSESQLYEDIGIEVKRSGYVDYLVFSADENLTREKLVAALLPIINAYLEYEFDEIPFWSKENGIGEPEDEYKPTLYCCPAMDHWISSIQGRILKLEDGSLWVIYEQDAYESSLWLPIDDIIVEPTDIYGHYFLHKYDDLSDSYETVRAICVED